MANIERAYQITDGNLDCDEKRLIIWERDADEAKQRGEIFPCAPQSVYKIYSCWSTEQAEALREKEYPELPEVSTWDYVSPITQGLIEKSTTETAAQTKQNIHNIIEVLIQLHKMGDPAEKAQVEYLLEKVAAARVKLL